MIHMDQELINKFLSRVDKTDNCWNWIGFINKKKSPVIRYQENEYSPARISAELIGIILPNKPIQHKCQNNLCVNPDHFICGDEARFWNKVKVISNSCWEWQGGKNKNGYGKFNVTYGFGEYKDISAHRYSYQLKYKIIPADMWVCHTCDNPPCVNPDHLFLGNVQDNVNDCVAKNRHARGENNFNAKLTNQDVISIRERCNIDQLAKEFDVSRRSILDIIDLKTWKHVK